MTLQEKCIEILTGMLNREPTETEKGNVMTDASIVNQAMVVLLTPPQTPPVDSNPPTAA